MYKIYLITNNINHFKYVGMTKENIERRLYRHSNYTHNYPLTNAIKMYGIVNFSIEIIEDSIQTASEARVREDFWINKLKTQIEDDCGYNISFGLRMPKSTKIKHSKASLGKTLNNNSRKIPINDVEIIIKRLLNNEKQSNIAREYNVNPSTISDIYRKHKIRIGVIKPIN